MNYKIFYLKPFGEKSKKENSHLSVQEMNVEEGYIDIKYKEEYENYCKLLNRIPTYEEIKRFLHI